MGRQWFEVTRGQGPSHLNDYIDSLGQDISVGELAGWFPAGTYQGTGEKISGLSLSGVR